MADLLKLMQDPMFRDLPLEEKRKAFSESDTSFGSLPPEEQDKGINEMMTKTATYPQLAGRAVLNFPGSAARVVKGAVGMAAHPFRTAENIGGYVGTVLRAGAEQLLGEPVDPEAEAAVKTYAEPVRQLITDPKKALRSAAEWTSENPAEAGLMVSPLLGKAATGLKTLSETEKLAGIPGVAKAAEVGAGIAAKGEKLTSPLLPFEFGYKKVTGALPPLREVVKEGLVKGGRFAFKGKATQATTEQYIDRGVRAVSDIIGNKDKIQYMTPSGAVETGRIPASLSEADQAVSQMKRLVFEQSHGGVVQAGEAGAMVNAKLRPLVSQLRKYASRPEIADLRPEMSKYAMSKADAIEARISAGGYSPLDAENMISTLNNELHSFMANPGYKDATQTGIDVIIKDEFRRALDDTVNSITDVKYQELKSRYSDLKAIEDDIHKRVLTDARRGKRGFFDVSDVFSGYHGMRALITGDPAGVVASLTAKGISMYYKYMNNPNNAIKNMFQQAEKILSKEKGARIAAGRARSVYGTPIEEGTWSAYPVPTTPYVPPAGTPNLPTPYTPPVTGGPLVPTGRGIGFETVKQPRLEWWRGEGAKGVRPVPGAPSATNVLPPGIGFVIGKEMSGPGKSYPTIPTGKARAQMLSKKREQWSTPPATTGEVENELRMAHDALFKGVPIDKVRELFKARTGKELPL